MKKFLMILSIAAMSVVAFACSKGGGGEDPTPPGPVAPTSISITPTTINAAQAGESVEVTITAPARPSVSGLPSWITYTDGTYNSSTYKITIKLNFTANNTYEARTAELKITAAGATSVTFTVSQAGKEVVKDPTLPNNDAVAMAKKIGMGWNLGNQLEANNNGVPSETAWTGVLCTQETFTKVAAAGFTSVRIPVSWMSLIGEAPDYTLDATRLARLKEVVGFVHNAGMLAIFNIHHDGAESKYWLSIMPGADNAEILKKIEAIWRQLAEAFKDEGDWLMFESFNEINDGGWGYSDEYKTAAGKKRQNDILNGWNQKFVDVVRATGGNNATRWLGVPAYCASPEFALEDGFVLPTDAAKKIMVSVHEYTPYAFCQTAEANEWGHTRKTNLNDPSFGEDYMKDVFNKLYKKYVANNIPVYIGEFGCANRTAEKPFAFQLYWYEYFAKCARVFGMGGMLWDNGASGNGNEVYGVIHHGNGSYLDATRGPKIVEKIKKGFTNTDESYTLQSVYDNAPSN